MKGINMITQSQQNKLQPLADFMGPITYRIVYLGQFGGKPTPDMIMRVTLLTMEGWPYMYNGMGAHCQIT